MPRKGQRQGKYLSEEAHLIRDWGTDCFTNDSSSPFRKVLLFFRRKKSLRRKGIRACRRRRTVFRFSSGKCGFRKKKGYYFQKKTVINDDCLFLSSFLLHSENSVGNNWEFFKPQSFAPDGRRYSASRKEFGKPVFRNMKFALQIVNANFAFITITEKEAVNVRRIC